MNGVMIGPIRKKYDALKKADWLVVCEIYPERDQRILEGAGITGEELKKINRRSTRLRAPLLRGEGRTFRQFRRWLQWKNVALPRPGEPRSIRRFWPRSS